MNRICLVAPLLVALAGCNTGASSGPSLDMMATATAPAAVTRAGPPRAADVDAALARLPEGAGAIRAVRERYYPNGYSQDIVLESDAPGAASNGRSGLSHIAVAIQNGRTLASSDKVPVWKPGEAGIKDELAREFPNLPMRVVANAGYENRYGRFGVAIARDGDALRCIYAWQYVDDARRSFAHGARIPLAGGDAAPAAVRIKLCRADATVDELVAHVRALAIEIPENYAASPPVALRIAPARAPRLRAVPASYLSARASRPFPARVVHRRPAAPPAEPDYAGYAQPASPSYPAAPLPQPGYGGVLAPAAAGAPRYLAPVPATVASGATVGLNSNLPPQAYRGPGARASSPAAQNPYRRDGVTIPSPTPAPAAEGAPQIVPLVASQN